MFFRKKTSNNGMAEESKPDEINVEIPRQLPTGNPAELILVELPGDNDDLKCIVTKTRQHSSSSLTMLGVLGNVSYPSGTFSLTCSKFHDSSSCIGNIRPDDLAPFQWELRSNTNGLHTIRKVSVETYQDEIDLHDEVNFSLLSDEEKQTSPMISGRRLADTNNILDVMVVWTAQAYSFAGGSGQMKLMTNLMIEESNEILENSAVSLRFRLVHVMTMSNTAYVDEDLGTILDKATYTGSPYSEFDSEQTIRFTKKADTLIIISYSGSGIGWLPSALSGVTTATNTAVVGVKYALGYYSFAHEIGHNFGCMHNKEETGTGMLSNSYAYCWDTSTATSCDGTCRRSVLSYSSCVTASKSCTNCVRYPYYSNKAIYEAGSLTGTSSASNAGKCFHF
jgi:hypothetical protein